MNRIVLLFLAVSGLGAAAPESAPRADPATFQELAGRFGKDAAHVFHDRELIPGADPASFQVIDDDWARDARAVYRHAARCEACDAATFRRIGKELYADKAAVYLELLPGTSCASCDADRFVQRHPELDPASTVRLSIEYVKDRNRVLLVGWEVPGADAASFTIGPDGPQDRNRCYVGFHSHPCPTAKLMRDPRGFPGGLHPFGPDRTLLRAEHGAAVSFDGEFRRRLALAWGMLPTGGLTVSYTCRNEKTVRAFQVPGGLRPWRYYELAGAGAGGCDVEVKQVALVRGRIDGPPIWIEGATAAGAQAEGAPPSWTVERPVPAGRARLTVKCRAVTRTSLIERTAEVDLDAKATRIYELSAPGFAAPDYRCEPAVKLLGG